MKLLALVKRRTQRERELNEEIHAHLAMAIRGRMEQDGKSAEVEANARHEFGNAALVKEVIRDTWGWRWLETLRQDIGSGLRQLRRHPGFTAVAVITLALGIGANTAIFSLTNAGFFCHLPYLHASPLAFLWQANKQTGETEGAVSYPNYTDWRAQFVMVGREFLTRSGTKTTLMGANGPERVSTALVSTQFLVGFRCKFTVGPGLCTRWRNTRRCRHSVSSYGLCRARFASYLVGPRENFGGEEETIVAVTPPGVVAFPTRAETLEA